MTAKIISFQDATKQRCADLPSDDPVVASAPLTAETVLLDADLGGHGLRSGCRLMGYRCMARPRLISS
jgi:hypothetical protein